MRGGRENNKIQRYEEYRFENNEQETIIFLIWTVLNRNREVKRRNIQRTAI